MRDLNLPDQVLFGLIYASLLFTLVYAILGLNNEFATGFAMEDGPVEYGTSIMLFLSSLVLLRHGVRLLRAGRAASAAILFFYGVLFIFGAGEEISWGQRIFGIETPEFFMENNFQQEITIHNLVVGERQLTKTLFGSVLTVVILLYLVGLPLLYPRVGLIAKLADKLMVPVPSLRHTIVAVTASIVMLIVVLERKWEVYEFIFGLLTMSIFLAPANAARFLLSTQDK